MPLVWRSATSKPEQHAHFPPRRDSSQPGKWPEGPINWSPDSRTVAVFDGDRIKLVDVATAKNLGAEPSVRGDTPNHPISARTYPPGRTGLKVPATIDPTAVVAIAPPPLPVDLTATSLAPVFLDANTLVVNYDCCIGWQHIVSIDLRTGKRAAFATLYGPPENITRLKTGSLLIVTAAGRLVVATRNHPRTIATGIASATA